MTEWTKIDEVKIKRYVIAVAGDDMTLEQVPEKYREEVRIRVEEMMRIDAAKAAKALESESL